DLLLHSHREDPVYVLVGQCGEQLERGGHGRTPCGASGGFRSPYRGTRSSIPGYRHETVRLRRVARKARAAGARQSPRRVIGHGGWTGSAGSTLSPSSLRAPPGGSRTGVSRSAVGGRQV